MKFLLICLLMLSQAALAKKHNYKITDWKVTKEYQSSHQIKKALFRKVGDEIEVKIQGISKAGTILYTDINKIDSKKIIYGNKSVVVGLMKIEGFRDPVTIIYNSKSKVFECGPMLKNPDRLLFLSSEELNRSNKEENFVMPTGVAFTASLTFPVN